MKLTILTAAAALLAAGAVSAASPKTPQATKGSTASENHVVVPKPDALQFQTAPNALPPGAQLVVLQGDMTKPGPFTARICVPANYRIPPHHHPVNEHVTVISGAVGIGMGDKFDETKLQ
ncbi:MAG: cupin domain-containing protein, partial [Myxococcales bacterium]